MSSCVASDWRHVVCVCLSVCLSVCLVPSGAPRNFTAIGLSPTSVRLQWDPPAKRHRHGTIVLYELFYHQLSQPLHQFSTNSTQLTSQVEGLEPNTDYSFQLRAYTSKGPGPWNNRLPFRTFGTCTYSVLYACQPACCMFCLRWFLLYVYI